MNLLRRISAAIRNEGRAFSQLRHASARRSTRKVLAYWLPAVCIAFWDIETLDPWWAGFLGVIWGVTVCSTAVVWMYLALVRDGHDWKVSLVGQRIFSEPWQWRMFYTYILASTLLYQIAPVWSGIVDALMLGGIAAFLVGSRIHDASSGEPWRFRVWMNAPLAYGFIRLHAFLLLCWIALGNVLEMIYAPTAYLMFPLILVLTWRWRDRFTQYTFDSKPKETVTTDRVQSSATM